MNPISMLINGERTQAGNGATFDPRIGKVIAGVDDDGAINLSQQPVSPYLAASSEGLWVPANEVGVPNGLFKASGNFSPRLGITWRPDAIPEAASMPASRSPPGPAAIPRAAGPGVSLPRKGRAESSLFQRMPHSPH